MPGLDGCMGRTEAPWLDPVIRRSGWEGKCDVRYALTKYSHWFGFAGRQYIATKNGSTQISSAIATIDRSLTNSDTNVIANMEIMPPTWYGMASRFVWKVEKLVRVREFGCCTLWRPTRCYEETVLDMSLVGSWGCRTLVRYCFVSGVVN